MRCGEFRLWLDRGSPAGEAAAAREHASHCVTCARLLTAEEEIERLLAEPVPAAPAGFTERLMARLPAELPAPAALSGAETPWWLGALLDPAALLALALAGVVTWLDGALWRAGAASTRWLTALVVRGVEAGGLRPAFDLLSGREVMFGLELALACLLLLGTPALVRWAARAGRRTVAIRLL